MSNLHSLIPDANQFISLEQAIAMTSLYRKEKENILVPDMRDKGILPICETFNREAFDFLLNEAGCVGIRIYLGMDETFKVKVIAVGVNDKNEDMLPPLNAAASRSEDASNPDDVIVENGQRCPTDCPPDSPLN